MGVYMKITEAIIVEGTYDVIKLKNIVDAIIVKVDGFKLFANDETLEYIRSLAQKTGIVVFTDSDRAGFLIRNYIKSSVSGRVLHAYIPDITGKEKRKKSPSKEGFLGVEGVSPSVIISALETAGCTIDGAKTLPPSTQVTRGMLYEDGLIGTQQSAQKRRLVAAALSLPSRMSTTALVDALNTLHGYEKYKEALSKI